jgi:hypothetical protein
MANDAGQKLLNKKSNYYRNICHEIRKKIRSMCNSKPELIPVKIDWI